MTAGVGLGLSDADIAAEAWGRLGTVYDPEIGIDLVDLGLIYDLEVKAGNLSVTMSLTTPGCPMSESMPEAVERALNLIPGVAEIAVRLVWEPAWTPEMMTEEAGRQLGFL